MSFIDSPYRNHIGEKNCNWAENDGPYGQGGRQPPSTSSVAGHHSPRIPRSGVRSSWDMTCKICAYCCTGEHEVSPRVRGGPHKLTSNCIVSILTIISSSNPSPILKQSHHTHLPLQSSHYHTCSLDSTSLFSLSAIMARLLSSQTFKASCRCSWTVLMLVCHLGTRKVVSSTACKWICGTQYLTSERRRRLWP